VPAGLKSQLVPLLSPEEIKSQCPATLAAVREKIRTFEKRQDLKDARAVFSEWNAISVTMEDMAGPIYLANSLSPNPQVRAAAEGCIIEIGKIGTEMMQSLAL
jgi:thimet oligopeptidase